VKLSEIREEYYFQTGKASDVARQLSYAGLAAVWVFKSGDGGVPSVPAELYPAAMLFATALFFDLMQYRVAAARWMKQNFEAEETGKRPEDEVKVPGSIHDASRWFTTWKVRLVSVGYIAFVLGLGFILAHFAFEQRLLSSTP
jgi:hypothetical protein